MNTQAQTTYVTTSFWLTGQPISKLEFEEGTNAQAPFAEDESVFLKDVHLHASASCVTALAFFVLARDEIQEIISHAKLEHYQLAISSGQAFL